MRAFIAVDLPGRIRESLQQLQGRLKPELGGLRWVRPIGIHLTLKFLGDIDGADVTSLSQALARDIPGSVEPFDLTVGGIGRFPQRGQPRVLWVGLAEADVVSDRCERLEQLRERVERTALAVGLEGETRPYHPHLTLARWERGGCGGPRKQDVSRLPGGQAVGTFHVSSICLFESLLGPGGARYRKVMEFSL